MEQDQRQELRSFIALRQIPSLFLQEPPIHTLRSLADSAQPVAVGPDRIFVRYHGWSRGLSDFELLWETEQEIETISLGDSGSVIATPLAIRTVHSASLWLFERSAFSFMAVAPGAGKVVSRVPSLLSRLLDLDVERVQLGNSFFSRLFRRELHAVVLEAKFRTSGDDVFQEFALSGPRLDDGISLDNASIFQQYFDTATASEVTIKLQGNRKSGTRVRISNQGRLTFLQPAEMGDMMRVVSQVHDLLLLEEGGRNER